MAVDMANRGLKIGIAIVLFLIALIFVYRSFYATRIPEETS